MTEPILQRDESQSSASRPSVALSLSDSMRTLRAIDKDMALSVSVRFAIAAIVKQADGRTGIAYASYRQLRRDYGLSMETIRHALQHASGKYLETVGRGRNGALKYRIKVGSASLSEAPSASLDEAPGASPGEARSAKRFTAGAKALRPAKPFCSYSIEDKTPLPPGGVVCDVSVSGQQQPPAAETVEQSIARIGAAHREVFNCGMDKGKWDKPIRALHQEGEYLLLLQIDAGCIRAASDKAKSLGRPFGFGWVKNHARERLTTAPTKARRTSTMEKAGEEADEASRRQLQEKQEYFKSLGPEQQESLLARARQEQRLKPLPITSEKGLEQLAVGLAWQGRDKAAVAVA